MTILISFFVNFGHFYLFQCRICRSLSLHFTFSRRGEASLWPNTWSRPGAACRIRYPGLSSHALPPIERFPGFRGYDPRVPKFLLLPPATSAGAPQSSCFAPLVCRTWIPHACLFNAHPHLQTAGCSTVVDLFSSPRSNKSIVFTPVSPEWSCRQHRSPRIGVRPAHPSIGIDSLQRQHVCGNTK
jgi:hypothetical protein